MGQQAIEDQRVDDQPVEESIENQIGVLLVDDDPGSLVALEGTLDRSDRRLLKAASGQEALKVLLEEDVAVVVLDVRMPGMDGFETARLIRGRDRSKDTPILFVTGAADEEQEFEGYSLGAVDFVFKPVAPAVLQAKVAVFVELFRKTEEVKRQAELLVESERKRLAAERQRLEVEKQRRKELARSNAELETEIHQLKESLNVRAGSVGADLYNSAPLQALSPDTFALLVQRYGDALDQRLDEEVFRDGSRAAEQISAIAEEMGRVEAGPRDVVEVHRDAVERRVDKVNPAQTRALIRESRVVVLELMGRLVSYYRLLIPRSHHSERPTRPLLVLEDAIEREGS